MLRASEEKKQLYNNTSIVKWEVNTHGDASFVPKKDMKKTHVQHKTKVTKAARRPSEKMDT